MASRVEVDMDLSQLEGIFSASALEAAQEAFANDVADDFAQGAPAGSHVPRDTGKMQDNVTVSGEDVTWTEDYAGYVYFGTAKMPGRPWFERAKGERLEAWEGYAADALGVGE